MEFFKKRPGLSVTVRLTDGTACLIRNAICSDAQALTEHMRTTAGETDNLLRYPEEISVDNTTRATMLNLLSDSRTSALLCALRNGVLTGTLSFSPISNFSKCRHRAQLGVAVRRKFWHLGIGRALMDAGITLAREYKYSSLELDVIDDNLRAIALYRSYGFTEHGRIPRAYRLKDGSYKSLILMHLFL